MAIQVVAVLVVAGCFLISGVQKATKVNDTAQTFVALGVPAFLNKRWVHRVYPLAEVVIGLAVLLGRAYLWWLASLAATILLVALSMLVTRVVIKRQAAVCNCFGTTQAVTKRTVMRNLLFLAFALVLLLPPVSAPSPVLIAAVEQPALLVALIVAMAATLILTALSTAVDAHPTPASDGSNGENEQRVPLLELLDSRAQPHFLPALVAQAPTLFVYVKPGCGPCELTVDRFEHQDSIAGRVVVRLVERTPATGPDTSRERLWDYEGKLAEQLNLQTPSAVLVSADGSIAAATANGFEEIVTFAAAIAEAVTQSKD